jgi:hypothetical protein
MPNGGRDNSILPYTPPRLSHPYEWSCRLRNTEYAIHNTLLSFSAFRFLLSAFHQFLNILSLPPLECTSFFHLYPYNRTDIRTNILFYGSIAFVMSRFSPAVAPAVLLTGFDTLDTLLGGGYPQGRLITLTGNPHTAWMLLRAVRRLAYSAERRVAVFRVTPQIATDATWWSTVEVLVRQGAEVLFLPMLTPLQLKQIPATLLAHLETHQSTIFTYVSNPCSHPTALRLHVTPGGWKYRARRIVAYRAHVMVGRRGCKMRHSTVLDIDLTP